MRAIGEWNCRHTGLEKGNSGGEWEIMAHLKMQGLEAEMLPVFVKSFPRAFFPSGLGCRPLRIGIFEDLKPGEAKGLLGALHRTARLLA